MKKLSIAMYSTYFEKGWKSEQLKLMIPFFAGQGRLEVGYGIRRSRLAVQEKLDLSIIPLMAARLTDKLSFLPFIKDYYGYLVGEYLTGILFRRKLMRDDSSVVYLKARPFSLVNAAKSSGKRVVLEVGELHPCETRERVTNEYAKYDASINYIFNSQYAVDESLKSINIADEIVVLSQESKNSFIKWGVPEEKLHVINLGLAEKIPPQNYDSSKEYAFVSTAKHSFVKGTHSLLLAWRQSGIQGMKLYIAGDLSDDIKQFIEREGPFDNVVYLGKVSIADLYKKYNFIGVLNSVAEGFGRSVIEYLGYGFPVIVTPVATCDIVRDGENGFVVDGYDQLVNRLKYFSNSMHLYEKYSVKAASSAQDITLDRFVRELGQLIEAMDDEN